MTENACKLCGDKLEKKEGDALYYCMKCDEEKKESKEHKHEH
ncbi:MAG: hypothetical protein U9O94_11655 [Nanoarchaeota archaeon]|nr:hypothetical protein [Nanoarchaeota archaeon]